MNLDTVDELLAEWTQRLEGVDDALLTLEADAAHAILTNEATRATLDDLYERRARFGEALDEAQALRGEVSDIAFWEHGKQAREILALFPTPADEDLTAMERACSTARASLDAAFAAWDWLEDELVQVEKKLDAIVALADALAEPGTTRDAIAICRSRLDRSRASALTDPLAARNEMTTTVVPAVDALDARLRDRERARAQVGRDLSRARALRQELVDVHAEALTAARDLRRDFAGPYLTVPAPEDAMNAALASFVEAERLAAARAWDDAAAKLAQCLALGARHVESERAVLSAAHDLRARRDELRDRLLSRRGQAMELAARGIADAADSERQDRVAAELLALLDAQPALLDDAEPRVLAYERDVIALARRARGA